MIMSPRGEIFIFSAANTRTFSQGSTLIVSLEADLSLSRSESWLLPFQSKGPGDCTGEDELQLSECLENEIIKKGGGREKGWIKWWHAVCFSMFLHFNHPSPKQKLKIILQSLQIPKTFVWVFMETFERVGLWISPKEQRHACIQGSCPSACNAQRTGKGL